MAHANTSTSKCGIHAKDVGLQSLVVGLMNRLADITGRWKSWPGTGIVLPQLVELTTLPAEQTATNVVHLGVMSWAVEVLVVMAISYQDGKPVTGFALGKFTLIESLY